MSKLRTEFHPGADVLENIAPRGVTGFRAIPSDKSLKEEVNDLSTAEWLQSRFQALFNERITIPSFCLFVNPLLVFRTK